MNQIPYDLILIGLFIAWLLVDPVLLTIYRGPLKRGVPIWRESLPSEIEAFLRSLSRDYTSWRGFIKTNGEEVLIRAKSLFWRTAWPYVGYIDLRSQNPKIEYRISLPMLLFLLPFVISIIAIPFVVGLLVLNHVMEQGAIRGFIQRAYQTDMEGVENFSSQKPGSYMTKVVLGSILITIMLVLGLGIISFFRCC